MHWIISVLLLLSSFSLKAQSDQNVHNEALEGSWAGVLTHPGGYRSEYSFHLEVKKTDEGYKCWSIVKVDEIYAEMLMSGTSFGEELFILEDKELQTHDIGQGMEWCMKRYLLRLVNENGELRLEGDWEGSTSFGTCEPGKVRIIKQPPRV